MGAFPTKGVTGMNYITRAAINTAEALSSALLVNTTRAVPCGMEMVRMLEHIDDLVESLNKTAIQLKTVTNLALFAIDVARQNAE